MHLRLHAHKNTKSTRQVCGEGNVGNQVRQRWGESAEFLLQGSNQFPSLLCFQTFF